LSLVFKKPLVTYILSGLDKPREEGNAISLSLVRAYATEEFYVKTFDWLEFGYFYGVEEALRQQGFPFKVLSDSDVTSQSLEGVAAVILPEVNCVSDEVVEALANYVQDGGKVLAIGRLAQRYENGVSRSEPSGLESLFRIEQRVDAPVNPSHWPWWNCRFTLRLTEKGGEAFRDFPSDGVYVYMDNHAPRFSQEVDVLAQLFIGGSVFKGICAGKVGKGGFLWIIPPLGQNIYDYLKDHRYAFHGSLYQTDMPRRFFYPIDEPRYPARGVELSCTYLCEVIRDALRFLLRGEAPNVEKWRYPDGVDAVVVATHDYDAFSDEQVKVYANLQRVHEKYGIRATHFFMADTYPLDSESIQGIFAELRQHGDEVGLHTTVHTDAYTLQHMKKELLNLETALGLHVPGESQHGSLSYSDSYRKAPRFELPVVAAEAGLEYTRDTRDSRSIVPSSDGAATCFPYMYPQTDGDGRVEASRLLNIPMMFIDAHYIHLRLSKGEILAAMKTRFDATIQHHGVYCFCIHPHYNRLPDERYADVYEAFIEYTREKNLRWWTAIEATRWEKAFTAINVEDIKWDGKNLTFIVKGPEEAFTYGKITLRVNTSLAPYRVTVDGKPCLFEPGDGFVKIQTPTYGHVTLETQE